MERLKLISADSHVIEPGDLWTNYMAQEFKDRAPRVEREDDNDVFKCEGITLLPVGALSAAGRPSDKVRAQGSYNNDVPPGSWDPHERVKEMVVDGVEAEVLYPSIALRMFGLSDRPFQLACFQAYNSWLADYCQAYPNRLKGIAMLNVDSVEDGVGELKRAKKLGLAGGMIPQRPVFGRYDSPMYEPLWEASTDLDMPLAIHIGCSRWTPSEGAGAVGQSRGAGAGLVEFTNQEYDMKDNIASIIYSGVFERHPTLKIGLVEYEVSWAPYLLYRMDRHYEERPAMFDETRFKGDMIPSDFFKRNVYLSFQEDPVGIQLREYVGVETLMWGSDYPHAESTFPKSREIVDRILEGVPEEEKILIAGENCAKMFNVS